MTNNGGGVGYLLADKPCSIDTEFNEDILVYVVVDVVNHKINVYLGHSCV